MACHYYYYCRQEEVGFLPLFSTILVFLINESNIGKIFVVYIFLSWWPNLYHLCFCALLIPEQNKYDILVVFPLSYGRLKIVLL